MRTRLVSLGALFALALAACGGTSPEATNPATQEPAAPSPAALPMVAVRDQDATAGTVMIEQIIAADPGWIVIHTEQNGGPGPVVGYAGVPAGESNDVVVEIDTAAATPRLYAMLHADAGTPGTYEFPGADAPVAGDQTNVPFAVTLPTLEPSVSVGDQPVVNGTLMIDQIVAAGPAWIVIHSEANGGPGPVAGYAGAVGTYEFPGADVPVAGESTNPRFSLVIAEGFSAEVEMEDFRFSDINLVVHAGTTVTWTNKDDTPHSSTSDDGLWDSGLFAADESYSFTFETPGSYAYYCTAHGGASGAGMAATVTVIP